MATFLIEKPCVPARNRVTELLRADHRRLLQEFREFERLEMLQADRACQRVVQRTLAELKVLAQVQEQHFYPTLQAALGGTDLIEQSRIEHTCIARVVAELERVPPDDDRYWKRFHTLAEYVRRHIEDEEGELFPMLSCVSIDWDSLHRRMTECRAAHAEELGVLHVPQLQDSMTFEPDWVTGDDELDAAPALEAQH